MKAISPIQIEENLELLRVSEKFAFRSKTTIERRLMIGGIIGVTAIGFLEAFVPASSETLRTILGGLGLLSICSSFAFIPFILSLSSFQSFRSSRKKYLLGLAKLAKEAKSYPDFLARLPELFVHL
jgi:hypothetical protein